VVFLVGYALTNKPSEEKVTEEPTSEEAVQIMNNDVFDINVGGEI
jgi:hypothetical protein